MLSNRIVDSRVPHVIETAAAVSATYFPSSNGSDNAALEAYHRDQDVKTTCKHPSTITRALKILHIGDLQKGNMQIVPPTPYTGA